MRALEWLRLDPGLQCLTKSAHGQEPSDEERRNQCLTVTLAHCIETLRQGTSLPCGALLTGLDLLALRPAPGRVDCSYATSPR